MAPRYPPRRLRHNRTRPSAGGGIFNGANKRGIVRDTIAEGVVGQAEVGELWRGDRIGCIVQIGEIAPLANELVAGGIGTNGTDLKRVVLDGHGVAKLIRERAVGGGHGSAIGEDRCRILRNDRHFDLHAGAEAADRRAAADDAVVLVNEFEIANNGRLTAVKVQRNRSVPAAG